jgi:hypothetical protein
MEYCELKKRSWSLPVISKPHRSISVCNIRGSHDSSSQKKKTDTQKDDKKKNKRGLLLELLHDIFDLLHFHECNSATQATGIQEFQIV